MLFIDINHTTFINAEIIALIRFDCFVHEDEWVMELLTKNGKEYTITDRGLIHEAACALGIFDKEE